jgi:hypothetical protein
MIVKYNTSDSITLPSIGYWRQYVIEHYPAFRGYENIISTLNDQKFEIDYEENIFWLDADELKLGDEVQILIDSSHTRRSKIHRCELNGKVIEKNDGALQIKWDLAYEIP